MNFAIKIWGRRLWFACLVAAAPVFAPLASAQEAGGIGYDRDIFLFGGVMTEGSFPGWSNIPFAAPLEDNYIVGAAVDYRLYEIGPFRFGAEIGLAGRFGDGTSADLWAGASFRHSGFTMGPVTVGTGFVFGLSVVTDAIGVERTRAAAAGMWSPVAYYLGPEIWLVFESLPHLEFIFRTHHRSGGKNVPFLPTFGGMGDVSNANVFGVRKRF